MTHVRFWGTAAAGAAVFALVTLFLTPFELLGADAPAERHRIWLLTLWTGGVMAICFGGAGLISAFGPIGFRDVAEVGSVSEAIEARREMRRRSSASPFLNFAGWMVATGGCLVLIYFVAWASTR